MSIQIVKRLIQIRKYLIQINYLWGLGLNSIVAAQLVNTMTKMLFYLKRTYFLGFVVVLFVISNPGLAQEVSVSERKKIRYLKKVERKNERYVKKQETKTRKLLAGLSEREKGLYEGIDSIRLDSALGKNSFSKIADRLDDELNAEPEVISNKLSQPINLQKSITISENLEGDIKDYLNQQLLTTSFLSDSACTTCAKLKEQSEKAKASIAKTSEKLERLKSVQADIKKHQETLKNYGVKTPELADHIKGLEKTSYYYNQGMNGFRDLYTKPAKGIESSLLKKLSFSKDFKLFQQQFHLPSSISSLSTGAMPDMSGYQTKAQVQAMLPQNAPGISPEVKTQLLNNIQNSLTKFTELRDDKPELSMLKDKPDFKVNPYKGLPLRKRLVPGFTFQPQLKKQNEPFTIDLGATLGFKLTQRFTPLIGASTKTGLGKDIHHIAFSYQGIVARAGMDAKLCYGFSFQCWYEATWKPLPEQLISDQSPRYPEPSLIAGICHTYKISKKVNGTLMLGYDFFYRKHMPVKTPWVIRMGWQ